MLISSYNPNEMGDVLVVVTGQAADQNVKQNQGVVQIVSAQDGSLLGYNFLKASEVLPELKEQNGQVFLSEDQVEKLNEKIQAAGCDEKLTADETPKFVIGYVESMTKHPKSDHLHITQVDLGDQKVQIVCGSPNIAEHVKVVVAKVGAMMPSGQIIWPGALVGVPSNGMICAARELNLKNAPQKPGCLILPDDFGQAGDAFDFARGDQLFA